MSIYLCAQNDSKPITYFTERGLSSMKATQMSELVCNAIKVQINECSIGSI